jgi:hypothetical protein
MVPVSAADRAQGVVEMVELANTSRGMVRLILREKSKAGGWAIDIMIQNLKGHFDPWRKIHIG